MPATTLFMVAQVAQIALTARLQVFSNASFAVIRHAQPVQPVEIQTALAVHQNPIVCCVLLVIH
jgi:hypothetical protein